MNSVTETELCGITTEPDKIVSPCVCCGGSGMDQAGDENSGGECPVCCREYDQPFWFQDDEAVAEFEAYAEQHGLPF